MVLDAIAQPNKELPRTKGQNAKVENQKSSELPVLNGVAHGSLLGPPFLLVNINQSLDIITPTNFAYADDLKVLVDKWFLLNINVRRFHEWCSDNLVSTDLAKTKYVAMKGCATVSLTKYSFEKADTMKDLGVPFSENQIRSPHAKKGTETSIKALYTFNRNIKGFFVNRNNAYVS